MNVNFPDLPVDKVGDIEITVQGRRKIGASVVEGQDPRGRDYIWISPEREEDASLEGSDLKAISEGRISVSPLCLDLTDHRSVIKLRKLIS
jgi:5'-nucleotidase